MELTSHRTKDEVILKIKGRLDSYWSSHFSNEMDRLIREGIDTITLDFSDVDFLSSAGIGVIMRHYNAISEMRGTLRIVDPQPLVRSVLQMTGLESYLIDDGQPVLAADKTTVTPDVFEEFAHEGNSFSVARLQDNGGMQLGVFGDPAVLSRAAYTEHHAESVSYSKNDLGIGLGAFGATFAECKTRFGEYLSLGGCTSFMPTDDTNVPDYLIEEKAFTPSVYGLYGIRCSGAFSHFIRFELPEKGNPLSLHTLVDAAFAVTDCDSIALGMVAESAGLIGSTLKRSPVFGEADTELFSHPGIRDWVSFTAEPAHTQTLAVVAGVATKRSNDSYSRFLRPDSRGQWLQHFHAMPCTMKPLGIGILDLHDTVCGLVRHSPPLDILHLLHDDRRVVGSGASEFLRGALWIAPIQGTTS